MLSFETNAARRTLVEFYDSEYLENIISLLYGNYSDVIYIYFARANEPTAQDRKVLSEYIRKNFGFMPKFLEIPENTIDCALKAFRYLVGDGGKYDFDITGGSSVFIAAAGALAVGDGGKRIFLHEYDPVSGKQIFSYPENIPTAKGRTAHLTVDHVLALRGIRILRPDQPIRYQLDRDDLRDQILRLWNTIRNDLKAWNSFSCIASNMERGHSFSFVDKLMNQEQRKNCNILLKDLSKNGIISDLHEHKSNDKIKLSYRLNVPESALFLYEKGGNILEMLTYLTAVNSGYFSDCCTGISLDWDNTSKYARVNPYNEIDTVLTLGHVPYFISCKNTDVTNDYLYEIMVMARHYGGKYAAAGLICTTKCNEHLHARAKEMGVVLIDDIAQLSADAFLDRMISNLCTK